MRSQNTSDSGEQAGGGIKSPSSAKETADGAIDPFEEVGGAKETARPGGETRQDAEESEIGISILHDGGDEFGLGVAISGTEAVGQVTSVLKIAGLEDGTEEPYEVGLEGALLGGGKRGGRDNSLAEVAELVEQAALLGNVGIDLLESSLRASATIMNEQFQSTLAIDATTVEYDQ